MNIADTLTKYIARLKTPTLQEQGKSGTGILGAKTVGAAAVQDDLTGLKGIGVYSKMRHDPDIKGALLIKTAGVLSNGWEIAPGRDKDEEGYTQAVEQADFVKENFEQMQGSRYDSQKEVLKDALTYGIGIEEWNWTLRTDGKIGLASIKAKDPAVYSFKTDDYMNVTEMLLNSMGQQTPVDISKFGVMTYQSEHGQPWGTSDLRSAYRYWLFKESFVKWWAIFLEKYGTPTAKGVYKNGLDSKKQDDLLAVLKSIQQETAIVLPDNVQVELLAANKMITGGYNEAIEFCIKQMVKAILGQSLVTEQGTSGTGSYAQAKVHQDAMLLYIRELKQMVEEFNNEGVVRRLIDYNFPEGGRYYPNFQLKLSEKDIVQLAQTFFQLASSDIVDPRESWVRDYLGLPEREEMQPVEPNPNTSTEVQS